MSHDEVEENWHDIYYTSHDGLRLYGRVYPAVAPGDQKRAPLKGRPVICIPGLSRNSNDFHKIASALSSHTERPRDVYCVDLRGRGRSEFDPNWQNYAPFIELIDVIDFMTIIGVHDAAILGTSRGGIIAMLMAAIRPTLIGTVILNDIGPVIERTGIARLKGYIGNTPLPRDWPEAAHVTKSLFQQVLGGLSDDDWGEFARQLYLPDDNGNPSISYDARLTEALGGVDITQPLPQMWPQFEALRRVPAMLIRGERSDILSEETAQEMAKRHARMEYFIVGDQGHAPLLWDDVSQSKIADFLLRTETGLAEVQAVAGRNVFVAA